MLATSFTSLHWFALTSNLYHSSLIIGNTDIDFLSPHLPTSPPGTSVLNAGLVGNEMTVASEIPLCLL